MNASRTPLPLTTAGQTIEVRPAVMKTHTKVKIVNRVEAVTVIVYPIAYEDRPHAITGGRITKIVRITPVPKNVKNLRVR